MNTIVKVKIKYNMLKYKFTNKFRFEKQQNWIMVRIFSERREK